MTPKDFIAQIGPAAQESAKVTKVPASFTVAEAALESGWGAHAPGMNLFGVKADKSWKGPVTVRRTREIINKQSVIVEAKFRAYSSWVESLEDHAHFLVANPRYDKAFECTDGVAFCKAVAAAGYATDPDYADKIIDIIDQHQLTTLDA